MQYTKEIGNSLGLWLAVLPLFALVVIQAVLIYRKAKQNAAAVGLAPEDQNKAFKTGILAAIGPSFSSMVSTIAMMAIMGAPVTLQRVSIIASASTELRASQYTAEAAGINLANGMPLQVYDAALWVMAINGCGWLLFVLLFNDKMGKITNKLNGGDKVLIGAFSISAMIGTVTYMSVRYLTGSIYRGIALGTSVATAFLVDKLSKIYPGVKSWNMGISLLSGMMITQILRVMKVFG